MAEAESSGSLEASQASATAVELLLVTRRAPGTVGAVRSWLDVSVTVSAWKPSPATAAAGCEMTTPS